MLKNGTLLELDTGALLAGTSYKGEIEDRLKKVINECKKLKKQFFSLMKFIPF
jgi:ATP-dependent Clp protease ATP-binding subunit ClpA